MLEDDEIELLASVLENIEVFIDVMAPLIMLMIPVCIWMVRSRI